MQMRPISSDDFPEVLDLHRRSEAFDGIPRVMTLGELVAFVDGVHTDLATDTMLVEVDNTIVGYLHAYHLPSDVRLERCYVFGLVDPAHRRKGLGSSLMRWGMQRAEELLRSSGSSLPKFIRTDQYDSVESSRHLFLDAGLTPVRNHDQMRQPLNGPYVLAEPEGISIIAWPSDRQAEIREVKNAAFADHWGSTPTSPDSWEEMLGEPTVRFDLSFVATTGNDEIVGYTINERFAADDELLGRKEGWIGNLGTLDSHRGRGIASALINYSLDSFANAGLTHACLDVDSDSLTGARRLYENLGFKPQTRTTTYERQIDSGAT